MKELSSLQVAIVGVGLIGGSLARALKAAGVTREIVGMSRKPETLNKALELGVIDRGETQAAAVGPVDILVIATPVRAVPDIMHAFAPHLSAESTVTDVGSVKTFVCEAAERHLGDARSRFVPGHPIAGTEHAGVEASFASLFENRTVILTPEEDVSGTALETVDAMWRLAGASVVRMDPRRHDELLAATSHLPHMVAYALVNCLARHPQAEELFRLAAGGFYDFTRIASSDPLMWRDIGSTNAGPLIESMKTFRAELDALIEALETRDEEALHRTFAGAKQARDLGLARKNGDR
ncbi:MAG: Cyclohexadienyl dehydrogenase [Gammaproteobacteria bacterium]|nr:Cyclohexadienyl dehydrogenase [Gammaproteobacteria bacterium]